jgi:hypothetical protein
MPSTAGSTSGHHRATPDRARRRSEHARYVRGFLVACLLAGGAALVLSASSAAGQGISVDGISDQSLPPWSDPPAVASASGVKGPRTYWPPAQIALARYVVQWNATGESTPAPSAGGHYRERFEAWLGEIRRVGLTPVLALTSYNGRYPRSPAEYRSRLEQLLQLAAGAGTPIAYVEPWNEPNNQGHESAADAARLADAANALCRALARCSVIAGDFEDNSTLSAYEIAYERALDFHPGAWGVHPYFSVATHDDAALLRFRANLPDHGVGAQIWFTEVGAYYCKHGEVRGEARQASDAAYLVKTLLADPALTPTHAFYYGMLPGAGSKGPCPPAGEDDTGLYGPGGEPRAAAGAVLAASTAPPQLTVGLGAGGGFGP